MAIQGQFLGVSPITAQSIQGNYAAIAAAGTTQGTATTVKTSFADVTSGTGGVVLLAAGVGDSQIIYNASGSPITVYPPTGAALNQLSANSGMTLQTNTLAEFWTVSATKIRVNLSA